MLREGVPAWHGSHYDIEVAALARAVDNAEGGGSVAAAAEAR